MSNKNLLIVTLTHCTYQLYGALSVLSGSFYTFLLGILIGITTYITYRGLFQENDRAISQN